MSKVKFVISKKKVLEQYNKLKDISNIISYSSKTNPVVTKILEESTNCMFSIHNINELKNIRDNSRILFLSQAWNQEYIKKLISLNINSFVVDNEPDLKELIKFLEKNSRKIDLFLRAKLKENTIRTERYFVFGMSSEIINKKIKELRLNNKIRNLGIHFHRKTQNLDEWNLKEDFEAIIDRENLPFIDIVNIGGGLPSEYANTNVNIIENIFKKILEFKEFLNKNKIKLMIEPGRFIAAPAGKLITEIVNIYENTITLNASVYNSDMDALIVPTKLIVENESKGKNAKPYVIKGITPCSLDLFRYKAYLKNPKIGDKIVFLNAGAYNFSTDFCNLDKIKIDII